MMKNEMQMNNKTALLAILAVFAMIATGAAVVMSSADVDADPAASSKWNEEQQGILDFSATGFTYEGSGFTNADLGNNILVRYDDSNNTYYVTGTINKQVYEPTPAASSAAIVKLYGLEYLKEKGTNYSLSFGFVSPEDGCMVKVGTDGAWSAAKAEDAVEDCNIVIKQAGKAPVTVKDGAGDETLYYIDTTGATFATSNSTKGGYVALYGANALAGAEANVTGIDTKGGSFEYKASNHTLTLNNYNGNETFNQAAMTKLILAGDNTISLKGALTAVSSNELSISNDSGVATLAVIINSDVNGAYGINSAGALSISGVDISVTIAGKATGATGIKATAFDVFNSTQVVSVLPAAYDGANFGYSVTDTDIKSSSITVVAGYKGFVATTLDVTASALDATASLYAIQATAFSVAQTSSIEAEALGLTNDYRQPYGIIANSIINKSYSEITADGIRLITGGSENYATITNAGNMLIESAATFTNKTDGEFNNTGIIGVVGGINVEAGTFDNDGAISTLKNVTAPLADLGFGAEFTKQQNYPVTIAPVDFEMLANGTISLTATVTFHPAAGGDDWASDAGKYIGIATVDETGKILTMNLTATSDNGADKRYTSRIALSSSAVGDAGNVIYSVISSGSYYKAEEKSTAGTLKTTAAAGQAKLGFATLADPTATLIVSGGDLINDGLIIIGSLKAGNETILSDGSFTSTGSFVSSVAITMTKGEFTSTGTMALAGNFAIDGGSYVGELVVDKDVAITVKGSMVSDITFAGSFTPAPSATNPNPAPILFSNTVDVAGTGKGTGFVITASQPIASETGYFALTSLDQIGTKGAAFILEEGTATIATAGETGLASAGTVTALAGTTLTNVAALKVSGVIAIEDGAVFNYFIEDVVETYTYGTLAYTISFANDGYTFYGNLAFALANAEEGMILNLAANETIDKDTAVKAGIQLVFAENAQLTIAGTEAKPITLTMGNGANFILDDGASVKIKNAKVSGTIVYEDNGVILNGLVIGNIDDVAINAVPEAGLVPAFIEFNGVTYSDGVIEMASGYFGGAITLAATLTDAGKVKTAAELDIDEDAISMVNIVAGLNAAKTKIVLDGTILVDAGNIDLFAPITGAGEIVLAAGATATLADEIAQSIVIGNGEDGFALDKVMSDEIPEGLLKFTSVAATATEEAYVKVFGVLTDGILTVIGDTATDDLLIEQNAAAETPTIGVLVIPEDTTFTVIKDSIVDVDGAIRVAGEFYYYTEETDKFGVVVYDITYEDSGYTVYAKLAGAAAIAPAGTDFEITKEVEVDTLVLNRGQTLTISGADGVLVVNNMVIIGNPATSIGADVDAIVGKVYLEDGAFAIAYSDSNIAGANFVYGDDTKAKYSNYTIANTLYCEVFASAGVEFDDVNEILGVPQIKGMKFQGWVTYVAGAVNIGDSDVYGRTIPVQYKITLKSIEGVVYKVAGSSAVVLDSPFYVDAGTVVNAVAASGYTGATQTWIVNMDQVIVASGFEPIVPEPTPTEKKDDTIMIALLAILVIMIAILVIVVIIRMMRS